MSRRSSSSKARGASPKSPANITSRKSVGGVATPAAAAPVLPSPRRSVTAPTAAAVSAPPPADKSASHHIEHKYAAPEPSYLSEYLWFPFYDHFVKLYPARWTPNGITLFGIFSTLLASFILFAAMPSAMGPYNANRSQFDAPSSTTEATDLLRAIGIHKNDNATTAVAANYLEGLRNRAATGLYGKPLSVAAESVQRFVSEVAELATTGSVATPPKPTAADGTPILGRSNLYDYNRPQLFYKALQTPLTRIEIALHLLYNAAVDSAFSLVGKVIGPDTVSHARAAVSSYVEAPFVAAYGATTAAVKSVLAPLTADENCAVTNTPGRWMLILAGILNLVYCVADNTDGRHARRTKQSSYVGEYLDHGLDCVTSLLTTYLLASALGMESIQAGVAVFAVATATVFSHIVNQEKGFLIWGNRFFSVDEAMIAFGFGLILVGVYPDWIPNLVPVDALVSLGVPTSFIPAALRHVRVGELLWFGFVASQLSVLATLFRIDRTIAFRPSGMALLANVATIWYLTNTVGQPTALRSPSFAAAVGRYDSASATPAAIRECVETVLSLIPGPILGLLQAVDAATNIVFAFEAQWAILVACTCSLIIHAPIAAKCLKVEYGTNNVAFAVTLPLALFTFFFVSSGWGAIIAVVGHVLQILGNIAKLQQQGALRAKAKKQN